MDGALDAGALLERDGEAAAVDAALDAAGGGHGTLLAVEGPPGGGVSAVIALALARGRARGLAVGEARATSGGRDAWLGVARQLLSELPAAPGPVLDGEPAAVAEAVLALVRRPGAAPGLLLAVDDAHHADPASLRALVALLPWVADLPLVLVLGTDPRAAPPELLRVLAAPAAVTLAPAPLSVAAVARLAARRLPEPADARVSAEVTRLAAGRPRIVQALLDALAEGDAGAALAGVPELVARRVRAATAALPDDAIALARALAVLDAPVSLERAVEATGLGAAAAGAAADALAAAGLIAPGEPLAFLVPLEARAVDAQTPPFERVARHRSAADALRGDPAAVERRARHLAHVPSGGDAETVGVLRAAATAATERDDGAAAVAYLRRALAEGPPAGEQPAVLAELALAEAGAGAPEAMARLAEALGATPDGFGRARLLLALARLHLARADYAAAARDAEAGMAQLGGGPLAEQLLVVTLIARTVDPTLAPEAVVRAVEMVQAAVAGELPDDPGLCAWLGAAVTAVCGPPDVARALLDRALRDTPLVDESHASIHSFARAALLNLDDVETTEALATAAMERAEARGWALARGLAQHGRAEARFRAGRLDEALADAEEALPLSEHGWTVHIPYAAGLLVDIHVERGDLARARAALRLAEPHAGAGPLERARVRLAALTIAAAEGRPGDELDAMVRAGGELAAYGPRLSPASVPWASQAALAALAAGRAAEARELAAAELEQARATGLDGPVGTALRAAALAEDGERRLTLLDEAIDALRRSPRRLDEARALADLGAALADAGRPADARAPLSAALDLAGRCGALVLADRARELLRRAGGRPRPAADTGAATLTPGERRVAERAATGESTSEIAAALYLSASTVEDALARAYRKLGIASRDELADALAGAES